MLAFINELDRALNAFDWAVHHTQSSYRSQGIRGVEVDIIETDEAYVVTADLPGLQESDLELTVKDKVLSLKAERPTQRVEGTNRRERKHLKLQRTFALPSHVSADAVEATLQNGVLTINVPKTPEAETRAIPIKAA